MVDNPCYDNSNVSLNRLLSDGSCSSAGCSHQEEDFLNSDVSHNKANSCTIEQPRTLNESIHKSLSSSSSASASFHEGFTQGKLHDDDEINELDQELISNSSGAALIRNELAEKICKYDMKQMDLSYTLDFRDSNKNSILHELARYPFIRHMILDKTKEALNLTLEEVELDSYIFTKELMSTFLPSGKIALQSMMNEMNLDHETPLMIAVEENRLCILNLFLPFAKLDLVKQPYHHTLLHLACTNGSYECLRYLMNLYYSKNRTIVNSLDCYGNTPLALAVKSYSKSKACNFDKIIKELILHGSMDLKAKNKDGNTIAHLISRSQGISSKTKISFLKLLNLTFNDIISDRNFCGQNLLDCWKESKSKSINKNEVLKILLSGSKQ